MLSNEDIKVNLPEGQSGPWTVKRFTVTPEDAKRDAMYAAIRGSARCTPAGTYTGLFRNGDVIMSDTPDEIRDHRGAIRNAKGHCLVLGLGIGMVVKAMLEKPEVTKVTVIEQSEDVITLTAPTLQAKYGQRFEVIQSDAKTWKPPKGVRYGCVWADIWDSLNIDNLTEMSMFNRRFARCSDWKGNWGEELLKYRREQENRESRYGRFR